LPKHIYDDGQDIKTHPRNMDEIIGSGPFKFKSFQQDEEVVLERFDDFFIEERPYLDKIIIKFNPDITTLLMSLERGDLQMVPYASDPIQLSRAQDNDDIVLIDKGYEGIGSIAWLAINTEREPLNDNRVLQASAYALDKDLINQALTAGFAQPAIGPIHSSSPYAVETNQYELDLDKANQLLDEAGLKANDQGERFKLTFDIMPGVPALNKNLAEYARSQLKKIGIQVELRAHADFSSWAKRMADHDFDISTDTAWNWGDPVIGVNRTYLSSNIKNIVWTNTQSYRNERVDELLQNAAIETDEDKRKAMYAEFQEIITHDLPLIYIAESPNHTLVTN